MRKLGGLLLVTLTVAAALLGAASAAAAEPEEVSSPSFPEIRSFADPEEYSWRLDLGPEQELRQIDEREAEVIYPEEGIQASLVTAPLAHAANGASVPTTLSVSGPKTIVFTVHHREGNPAAGGAPFDYPVIEGPGWEVGFGTVTVSLTEPKPAAPTPTATSTEPTKPQRVRVVRALGEDKLYYRPHFFLLSGDGSFGMSKVRWKSWGGATATATARAFVNDCVPYCAAGHIDRPRAKLVLSKVVDCNGTPIYAKLEYSLSGPLPKGFRRKGGDSMLPLGEDGKPEC